MQTIRTWAGVDVSARTLMSRRRRGEVEQEREFSNDPAGHKEMIQWLGKQARVCLEATGVYHLQLCLRLCEAGIGVMVVNPRVAKDFARALANRSKTDRVDARVLLEFALRMEFVAWQAPRGAVLELREVGRRISELVHELVDEKNRLHAKRAGGISRVVALDVSQHIAQIQRRIAAMEKAAIQTVESDADLKAQYDLLVVIKGIGRRSAILLMTELAVLDPTMTVRELVAHAGLDPRVYESGTSVHRLVRISKLGNARIRASLYLVALTAIRSDKGARSFYRALLARGKKKKQAIVAVMRKMLHGIWIALQRRIAYDSAVLFAASLAQAESSDSAVAALQPQREPDHPKGRSKAEELRQQLEPDPAEATDPRRRTTKAA